MKTVKPAIDSDIPLPLPDGRGSVSGCADGKRLCGRTDQTGKSRKRRLGATLVEFTMLGIPAIFICTSIVTTSIDMWQFFTLNYAVSATARYASMHGYSCTQNSNTCQVTRATVATYFENDAIALAPASTTLKLTDGSGTTTCNPVTSCPSSTTDYPANSYNSVGSNITVQATYTLINPIFMFWPGGGSGILASNFTVSASSTQAIVF